VADAAVVVAAWELVDGDEMKVEDGDDNDEEEVENGNMRHAAKEAYRAASAPREEEAAACGAAELEENWE
jgi:hypothetical protein